MTGLPLLVLSFPGVRKDDAPFFGDISILKIDEVEIMKCKCPHDR